MVSGSISFDTKPTLHKAKVRSGGKAEKGKKKTSFKKSKKGKKKSKTRTTPANFERPPGIKDFKRGKKLKNSKYFRRRRLDDPAWRPGRPYSDSYWTLGDANANFGPPGETLDRSVLKVLSYKFTIVAPSYISPTGTKGVDTRLTLPPLSMRQEGKPGKPQVLVLNPEYEPGVARFSLVIMRNVLEEASLHVLRSAVLDLEEADTTDRQTLLGLSSTGYRPASSYKSLEAFRTACGSLGREARKRLHYVDRQMIAPHAVMPHAVRALRRLHGQGYPSETFPHSDKKLKGLELPVLLGTSLGVAKGWGMTTFPADCAELYSFIAPLCPAHIHFEALGEAELDAGDVVAILASEVPTALTLRPDEGEGHAVMCWTEDRMMRLLEYEEWLRTGQ